MKFVSRKKEFRLIIRPTEVVMDASRRPHIMQGERVEFHQGMFYTEDKNLIEYLMSHPLYGNKFTAVAPTDLAGLKPADSGPKMIEGTRSTLDAPASKAMRPESTTYISEKVAKSVSKEEVEALIDNKLEGFLGKIESLLIKPEIPKVPEGPPLPEPIIKNVKKKGFHCPWCGESLSSGFEIGKHKKTCPQRPQE